MSGKVLQLPAFGLFGKGHNLLVQSDRTTQQMIVEPESVSIHTVMIAAQKAEMALSLARLSRIV